MSSTERRFAFRPRLQRILMFTVFLGLVVMLISLYVAPERSWINILLNNFYFTSLGLFGTLFIAIQSLAGASWATPLKRIPEAFTRFLPVGFFLMLIIFFGIHTLYEWSHHDVVMYDEILKGKSAYLNATFFMIRVVIVFGLWIFLSYAIVNLSRRQDNDPDLSITRKISTYSAVFILVFGLTYSVASFDWIMSLEPHWYSTIFTIYTFSGLFVNGIAVTTLTLIILQRLGYLQEVINENHYQDLGKWMFGFSTFWAYIWVSQYILIWYANIPEEAEYFVLRDHYDWNWPFYFNLVINWVIPFLVLLPRKAKRSKFVLTRVAILLIVGHWLDLYLMIAPKVFEQAEIFNPQIGTVEIGIGVGYAALFCLLVGKTLSQYPLIVKNDPYLDEGIHFHQ